MSTLFSYFRLLLLSVSGMLLLCIIFATNMDLANGVIVGKICWFHFATLLFACSVLFMEFTLGKSRFTFSLPDGLLLLLFGIILITYDWSLNLQPEKFLFACQLVALWFMLRAALQAHPELRMFFVTVIILTGMVGAVWRIGRDYGDSVTNHPLFRQLEDSLRLDPFTGYVAIILPLCLSMMLRFYNCKKSAWWETRTMLYYFSWIGTILILSSILVGTKMPVWTAATISCIWVVWMLLIGWKQTKEIINGHRRLFAVSSVILFFAIAGLALAVNLSKAESGDRRMLIWNVTTKAIIEHPVFGTGMGHFPTTYARTQAAYFTSEFASEAEKRSATYPDFAYNEYLQIGLEFGITGLLLFMLWLAFSLYYGIKHRQMGTSGALLSLGIFAMYSYSLQLPTFWVLLIFLTVICVTDPKPCRDFPQKSYPFVGALAAVVSCVLFFGQKNCEDTYREWKILQKLSDTSQYDVAASGYSSLYPQLAHKADFLLEGAKCFGETDQHAKAIQWLNRAMLLSANPALYYEMAENKQAVGLYDDAERYLLEVTYFLPKRGHSYYLLTKLYADSLYFHPEKLYVTANSVLDLQSVKHSGVTEKMKEEVCSILKELTP